MKENKFRAWDTKEKCWWDNWCIHCNGHYRDNTVLEDKVGKPYWNDIPDNIIIMQYTGLKDKNGKEIYEGDIVEGTTYEEVVLMKTSTRCRGVVKIQIESPCWVNWKLPDGYRLFPRLDDFDIEIIGNIYENPELPALNQRSRLWIN